MAAPQIRLSTITLDAPDAHLLADFYLRLLGWRLRVEEPDWVTIEPPDGGVRMSFQSEPGYVSPVWPAQAGQQQMMMHLEIQVDELGPAVEHALAVGATLADFQPQTDVRVCLDPAGHPFCLWIET
jgi:catechol 2,3-dioxygenase-like lactoylglutathione lyase family enzyme